jgi:hypothetical protein
MVASIEFTLEQSLTTVSAMHSKTELMHKHLQECVAKMQGWLEEAETAANVATEAMNQFVTTEDAEEWLPLLEDDTFNEIHERIARMREMIP